MDQKFVENLITSSSSKIVMIIMDGLGGLPLEPGGKTELESAKIPYMNALAFQSALGLSLPIGTGITTGSGPGHLAIFGYDPFKYEIGRGALEALGVDFDLGPQDLAARGNFCTLDSVGVLQDRRAGRLATELSYKLIEILRTIKVDGVEIFIEPVKEHRFAFIMRAPGLGENLSDTDPLKIGVPPLSVLAGDDLSIFAAKKINQFVAQAQQLLINQTPANGILLRGFAKLPKVPTYLEKFGLNAASIAVNGMYRGVSRLAGMKVLDLPGSTLADEFSTLEKHWDEFDFFYLHFKKTDTCGENGDFNGKVNAIEEMDSYIPRLMKCNPDVVIITGDHSSPALLRSHSWHPVPLMIYSKVVRSDNISEFGERSCMKGSLGILPAKDVMLLALANAGRLSKYGA